jgi:hypothetical protein
MAESDNGRGNYWTYSISCAAAWGIVLAIVSATRRDKLNDYLLVAGGASIGWASGTIARYVYPPPRRWHPQRGQGADPAH